MTRTDVRAGSAPIRLVRSAAVEAPREAPSPSGAIADRDFEQPLDRKAIRAADDFSTDRAFSARWRSAIDSPFQFFRSFPSAYYRDLRAIIARGVPGKTGVVLGDAHPDNFGFIRTARGTEFAYNDFDDSGRGPVAIDALRYFTALRLAYPGKDKLFDRTLDAYVRAVERATRAAPPKGIVPSWSDVYERNLKKFTSDERFRLDPDKTRLSAATPKTRADVRALLAREPRFGHATVLDVAMRAHDHGGSAGLPRVWILVRRRGELGIIELKTAAPPATEQLDETPLVADARMDVLKEAFFRSPADNDLFSVKMGGTTYLARDRSRMSNVSLEDLSKDELDDTLRAQVAVMADVHRSGWSRVEPSEMRAWIDASSQALAKRWKDAFERATR